MARRSTVARPQPPDQLQMLRANKYRSFKTRWVLWRARWSIPALLGHAEERTVVSIAASVNAALAILIIGVLAWVSELPLVFPALGPTSFVLFATPFARAAAPRSVVMGHLAGIGAGYVAWHVTSVLAGSPVTLEAGGWPACLSGSIALALACLLLVRFSVPHPPACASALIVALGAVNEVKGLLIMAAAVVLLTAQAVVINRICCLPVPTWAPRESETP
jgi:CBS-domain-containing membrane protein